MQIHDEVEAEVGIGYWRLGRILAERVATWPRDGSMKEYRVLIYGRHGGGGGAGATKANYASRPQSIVSEDF